MAEEPIKSETFDNATVEIWTHRRGDAVHFLDDDVPIKLNKVLAFAGADAAHGDPIDYYATLYPAFLHVVKDKDLSAALECAREFIAYVIKKYSKQHRNAENMQVEGLIDPAVAHFILQPNQLYEYSSEGGPSQLGVFRNIQFLSGMFSPPKPYATFISSSFQRGAPRNDKMTRAKGISISFDKGGIDFDAFEQSLDAEPPVFSMTDPNTGYWAETTVQVRLPERVMQVEDFPIKLADEAMVKRYAAQGETFFNLVSRRGMASFDGHIFYSGAWGPEPHGHAGRVMVDGATMHKYNPHIGKSLHPLTHENMIRGVWKLPYPAAACLYNIVPVFSLQDHKWGAVRADKLQPVAFRKDAIDRLVIEDRKKRVLSALVKNHSFGFKDLVDDKNSATIVLLAGPPGTGKSLTAQAVAESLELPLYTVNLDDTDDDGIEDKLTEIFQLTTPWDAVILIDEADAVMRKRESCEPHEARRVATFLRVVEAHEGIIFLTSNYADSIDEAMRSRVSVVIDYRPAPYRLRAIIWRNLSSSMAGITLNVSRLALWPLNGREIKHALKISGMLAKECGQPVTTQLIEDTLRDNYGPLWRMTITRFFSRLFK